jgi:hypothetical protein
MMSWHGSILQLDCGSGWVLAMDKGQGESFPRGGTCTCAPRKKVSHVTATNLRGVLELNPRGAMVAAEWSRFVAHAAMACWAAKREEEAAA